MDAIELRLAAAWKTAIEVAAITAKSGFPELAMQVRARAGHIRQVAARLAAASDPAERWQVLGDAMRILRDPGDA